MDTLLDVLQHRLCGPEGIAQSIGNAGSGVGTSSMKLGSSYVRFGVLGSGFRVYTLSCPDPSTRPNQGRFVLWLSLWASVLI